MPITTRCGRVATRPNDSQNLMTHVSSDSTSTGNRVRSIQYLRAIAALSVVAYHASKRVEGELSETAEALFYLGHGGVDLFFVISGFIMWSIGCKAPRRPGDFLLRRAIRVVPPYWIATLSWVAIMLVAGASWIVMTPAHVVMSLFLVPHWSPTFSNTFWPVLVPGWTLLFEMYFYALFALTLLFAPQWRLMALTSLLLVMVAFGAAVPSNVAAVQAYTSPLLLEFLAGCWIAELWRRGLAGFWLGIALCGVGFLVLIFLSPLAVPDETSWGRPLTFGLAGALIVAGSVALERFLPDLVWLEKLGDASYAIYLFHMFIVVMLQNIWTALSIGTSGWSSAVFIAGCCVLASGLGLVLFAYVERPLQRWFLRRAAVKATRPGVATR